VWYYFIASQDTLTVKAFNLSPGIAPYGVGFALYDSICTGTELDCIDPATNDMWTMGGLIPGQTYYLRTFTSNIDITGTYNLCLFGGIFNGIHEQVAPGDLLLFPDPTTGVLTISVADRFKKTSVKVYDMIGNLVIEDVMRDITRTTIDLSSFANGVYFVKVENENGLFTRKVILDK
jgi:hypothetical protein